METIKVNAPAKINVGLNIISKRSDGYHNLETVFYQIKNLFDVITFEKTNKLELHIENGSPELSENNIIIKAIKLLEKKSSVAITPKITLIKNIPIGAGLGGGSSDAAATLKAVNKLYNLNFSIEELKPFALELGSDVPLFLYDFPTIGKSRGEILEKSSLQITHTIVLVNPGIHISTKDAFSKIIPKPNPFDYSTISVLDIKDWNGKIINDFEESVFEIYPEVKSIKNTLLEHGALFALMSGSGSTVYGIFESPEIANTAIASFSKSYFTFIES